MTTEGKHVFTVHQIARMVGTCARTVQKWIDSGMLPGYRLPSTSKLPGPRRVTRDELKAFLTRYEIPFPRELQEEVRPCPTPSQAS